MEGLPRNGFGLPRVDHARWSEVDRDRGARGLGTGSPTSSIRMERRDQLARTIENEIIPRLMRAHCGTAPVASGAGPDLAEVEAVAALALGTDGAGVARHVESLRKNGLSLEALCSSVLAPAARRMGEMWEADLCGFAEVTLGLYRLQAVLRELGPEFPSGLRGQERGLNALLVPVPGESHTLGLSMVSEFFRRAGWSVWGCPPLSVRELRDTVAGTWFDVAGMSVGCASAIEAAAASIRAIRESSRNPNIGVMVGGPVFVAHPEWVAKVGADATAPVAAEAPRQAEVLVSMLGGARPG